MSRSFNGSSDYAAPGSMTVTSFPFSVSCWFKIGSSGGGFLWGANTPAVNNGWYLQIFPSSLNVTMGSQAGSQDRAFTSVGASAGAWAHALGVATSANVYSYLNGGSKGSSGNSYSPTPSYEAVGCRGHSAGSRDQYFPGQIADLCIWNVALADADAAQLAAGVPAWKIHPEGIVSYWPLIGKASPEIEVVSKNELTLFGTTGAEHPRIRKRIGVRPFAGASGGGGSGGGCNSNCFGHGFLPPLLRAAISN